MPTETNPQRNQDTPEPQQPAGPQGVDQDPEKDKPGPPGSDFKEEQKGKKVDREPGEE